MVVRFDWKKFIISVLIPLATGGLSALITAKDMDLYEKIKTPPLSPPSWVFPVAWTILYFLMGISFYLVWTSQKGLSETRLSIALFAVQLLINFIWSSVFFSKQWFLIALILFVLLWFMVLLMIFAFNRQSKTAAVLQIPYLIWLTFAGYLNLSVCLLNR